VTGARRLVLDAGALIALERNDRRAVALLARARELGTHVVVPATVLAQVIRDPSRQVAVVRLIRDPSTATDALDRGGAAKVGGLLRSAGTTDVVDGHVALCGLQPGATVVTSDGADIRRLHPGADLIEL
jgi:predicted nucleic acid-binding protein